MAEPVRVPRCRRFAASVENVVNTAEGREIVLQAQSRGWSREGRKSRLPGKVEMEDNLAIASLLHQRLRSVLPGRIKQAYPVGVCRRMTVLRFSPGQRVGSHTDEVVICDTAAKPTSAPDSSALGPLFDPQPPSVYSFVPAVPPTGPVDPALVRDRSSSPPPPPRPRARSRSGSFLMSMARGGGVDDAVFGGPDRVGGTSMHQRSALSGILFLNTPKSGGGAVRLWGAPMYTGRFASKSIPSVDVMPEAGKVLLFDHRISHAILPSTSRWYCVRFHVMFSDAMSPRMSVGPSPFPASVRNLRMCKPTPRQRKASSEAAAITTDAAITTRATTATTTPATATATATATTTKPKSASVTEASRLLYEALTSTLPGSEDENPDEFLPPRHITTGVGRNVGTPVLLPPPRPSASASLKRRASVSSQDTTVLRGASAMSEDSSDASLRASAAATPDSGSDDGCDSNPTSINRPPKLLPTSPSAVGSGARLKRARSSSNAGSPGTAGSGSGSSTAFVAVGHPVLESEIQYDAKLAAKFVSDLQSAMDGLTPIPTPQPGTSDASQVDSVLKDAVTETWQLLKLEHPMVRHVAVVQRHAVVVIVPGSNSLHVSQIPLTPDTAKLLDTTMVTDFVRDIKTRQTQRDVVSAAAAAVVA